MQNDDLMELYAPESEASDQLKLKHHPQSLPLKNIPQGKNQV